MFELTRPDIPAHTYQLTFEPNHEWPQFYAKATDIYKYWKKVADKYGCMKYIKLQHQVVEARWVADELKWNLKVCSFFHCGLFGSTRIQIKDLRTGSLFSDSCDIFLSATGVLNDWTWPSIPGLDKFKGKMLHSAKWDEEYDYSVSNYYIQKISSNIQCRTNAWQSLDLVPVQSKLFLEFNPPSITLTITSEVRHGSRRHLHQRRSKSGGKDWTIVCLHQQGSECKLMPPSLFY